MKLILLRHGESQWNLENRFTGWKDVPLTQSGIIEAQYAAEKLIEMEIDFNSIYTSFLLRAIHTAEIVAKSLKFDHNEIIKDENNNNKFVYAKAIRIKEVCLNCHGSNINNDLKKEIQKLYPDDKAINYKLNDIRGAFVMYRNIKD